MQKCCSLSDPNTSEGLLQGISWSELCRAPNGSSGIFKACSQSLHPSCRICCTKAFLVLYNRLGATHNHIRSEPLPSGHKMILIAVLFYILCIVRAFPAPEEQHVYPIFNTLNYSLDACPPGSLKAHISQSRLIHLFDEVDPEFTDNYDTPLRLTRICRVWSNVTFSKPGYRFHWNPAGADVNAWVRVPKGAELQFRAIYTWNSQGTSVSGDPWIEFIYKELVSISKFKFGR